MINEQEQINLTTQPESDITQLISSFLQGIAKKGTDPDTYREIRLAIEPNRVTPYFFKDTTPNVLIIKNISGGMIYTSASDTITAANCNVTIPPFGTGIFHLPAAINPVWFLSDSPAGAAFILQSVESKFDGSLIQQSQINRSVWNWSRITSPGAGAIVVKPSPGQVILLEREGAIDVTLQDGPVNAWQTGEYLRGIPITFNTDIRILFSAAGTAWILFA